MKVIYKCKKMRVKLQFSERRINSLANRVGFISCFNLYDDYKIFYLVYICNFIITSLFVATSEQNYPEREIRNIDQFVFGVPQKCLLQAFSIDWVYLIFQIPTITKPQKYPINRKCLLQAFSINWVYLISVLSKYAQLIENA